MALGVLQHFFDRSVAGEDAAQSVLSQRHHPELDRLLFENDRRGALVDQLTERVRELINERAPTVVLKEKGIETGMDKLRQHGEPSDMAADYKDKQMQTAAYSKIE